MRVGIPWVFLAAGVGCTSGDLRDGLVIEHVDVVDVEARSLQRDLTVVISGGRITDIGKADSVRSTTGKKLDGTGKFLIPGFWDMHVHLSQTGQSTLAVLLAHGIT